MKSTRTALRDYLRNQCLAHPELTDEIVSVYEHFCATEELIKKSKNN